MNVVVCGSENFKDKFFIEKIFVDIISKEQYEREIPSWLIQVISPNSPAGAEWHFERIARLYKTNLKLFPADWNNEKPKRPSGWGNKPVLVSRKNYYNSFNALAGYLRNQEIADYVMYNGGGICIAIDSEKNNKHVKDLISRSKKAWIKVYHVKYENEKEYKIKLYNENVQRNF